MSFQVLDDTHVQMLDFRCGIRCEKNYLYVAEFHVCWMGTAVIHERGGDFSFLEILADRRFLKMSEVIHALEELQYFTGSFE